MRAMARTRWVAVGLLLLTVAAAAAAACGIHTAPFRDAGGRTVPGSVAVMTDARIGGVGQRLWFRGLHTSDPAVVLLHGGPGASEAALFRAFNADLERRFLMIYWEQRGAGRSFHPDIPGASMTLDRFVRDLDEVVELVRARFHKKQVVLLGHSWGTAVGILYAARFPQKVAAYVGVSQVANMPEGERLSYRFATAEAARRQHRRALAELDRIGPPPHTVEEMLISRKWVERFGGSFKAGLSKGQLIRAALGTDEANLIDLIRFGRGNRFSLEHLWPAFRTFAVDDRLTSFETPVVFVLGRYDRQVPAVLAERYFHRLQAPAKRLVWFEHSAHNAPFEEPERFNRTLGEILASVGAIP